MNFQKQILNAALALKYLGQAQRYTEAKFLDDDKINEFEHIILLLQEHMIKYFPEVTIAEKGHLLFRHAVPWARQMKSLGIFTEQTIETSYSDYNYQYKRLCSKKESENL